MPKRLLHVAVPRGLSDRAEAALEEGELDYRRVDGDLSTLFVAYVPLEKVGDASDLLREAGVTEQGFVSISSTEALLSRRAEERERDEEEEEEEGELRVSRDELVSSAREMGEMTQNYLVLTVISSVIAASGVLADSTAVVIGSMVIAPLIGPAMASSVGTVTGEPELFRRGIFAEVVGLLVAVVSAAAFAALAFRYVLVPPIDILAIGQISERAVPGLLNVGIAFGAGVAGALSLTSGMSAALVGVMIAVALIPPAATVGIGIALGDPQVTLGSTVLLLVNVLSINLAGTLTFRYQGYAPGGFFERVRSGNALIWRVGFMLSFLVLLSTTMGVITYDTYTNNVFEQDVRSALTGEGSTLSGRTDVALAGYNVHYESAGYGFREEPSEVVVELRVSEPPPDAVAEGIARDVREGTGRRVPVVVEPREVTVVR